MDAWSGGLVIFRSVVAYFLFIVLTTPSPAMAAAPTRAISIHKGGFVPSHLELPAGVKVKLTITNADDFPAEFESIDLSREIIVPVQRSVTVFVGPLRAGRYEFFNDFNPVMRGVITVKPVNEGMN
jgi:plastocyanin domain-containing protein